MATILGRLFGAASDERFAVHHPAKNLYEFAKSFDESVIVEYRHDRDPRKRRFIAHVRGVGPIVHGGFEVSATYGQGSTPEEAIREYEKSLSGQVVRVMGTKILVPELNSD
jgi:hypothetical protein